MLTNKNILARLAKGGVWAAAGKLLFTLFTLTWNALLTRLLSEAEVGAFYILTSIVVFGELVFNAGMNQAVVKMIAVRNANGNDVRAAIHGTLAILAVSTLFFGFIYYDFLGPWIGRSVFQSTIISDFAGLTALWIGFRAFQSYLAFILRGFHKVGLAAYVDGTSTAIFLTLALATCWYLYPEPEINEILLLMIGALICTVLVSTSIVASIYNTIDKSHKLVIKEPLSIGIPLAILAITAVGAAEAQVWVAGSHLVAADVAIYGAALRLAKLIQMPLLIVNGVISSTVAQLSQGGEGGRLEKILQASALAAALPTFMIGGISLFYSGEILGLIFGQPYSSGSTVLVVLVVGRIIAVSVGSPGILMAMTNYQRTSMVIGIFSATIGIGISLNLVDANGILGIAIGATVGTIIQNTALWLICWKKLGIKTHASVFSVRDLR